MRRELPHDRTHGFEVIRSVDGPAEVTERATAPEVRQHVALGSPVQIRRHVLAFDRIACKAVRLEERATIDHLDVETLRKRSRQHIRGVVRAAFEVLGDDRFHDQRVGEWAIGREPHHVVGVAVVHHAGEATEHIELVAAHNAYAATFGYLDDGIVGRAVGGGDHDSERRPRGHARRRSEVLEPPQQELEHRDVAELAQHLARQPRRTGAGLNHAEHSGTALHTHGADPTTSRGCGRAGVASSTITRHTGRAVSVDEGGTRGRQLGTARRIVDQRARHDGDTLDIGDYGRAGEPPRRCSPAGSPRSRTSRTDDRGAPLRAA